VHDDYRSNAADAGDGVIRRSEEVGKMATKTRSLPLAVIVATVILVAITAVFLVDTGDQVAQPDQDGVLEIVLEDFEFEPSEFVLPAGEPVTLVFTNRQDFTHDLTFGRSVVQVDGRPAGFEEDLLAGLDARVTPPQAWITPRPPNENVTIAVAPNSTVTAEFVLPEDRVGTWQGGCFVGPGCDPRVGLSAEVTVE
jgi:uncharacterized cupredoxin-like copper-binding protein